jgi:hypothetical protein
MREMSVIDFNGDIIVEQYEQDADSWGWMVQAIFTTALGPPGKRRWGTLDCLDGTEAGQGYERPNGRERTAAEFIAEHWHLVDWHETEDAAREAFAAARLRHM